MVELINSPGLWVAIVTSGLVVWAVRSVLRLKAREREDEIRAKARKVKLENRDRSLRELVDRANKRNDEFRDELRDKRRRDKPRGNR